VDIYAYNGKYADYDKDKMYYLSQVIKDAAEDLGVRITWGGDWKSFIDMPHYELS
jgi:peptidoglycan L-alanyl-D-glutamate endopeptidase CwlK